MAWGQLCECGRGLGHGRRIPAVWVWSVAVMATPGHTSPSTSLTMWPLTVMPGLGWVVNSLMGRPRSKRLPSEQREREPLWGLGVLFGNLALHS